MHNPALLNGVAAKFVATETLSFLLKVLHEIEGRLINNMEYSNHKIRDQRKSVQDFIETSNHVIEEFQRYMYRNIPTQLITFHEGSSVYLAIRKVKWAQDKPQEHHNAYVDELLNMFKNLERVILLYTYLFFIYLFFYFLFFFCFCKF